MSLEIIYDASKAASKVGLAFDTTEAQCSVALKTPAGLFSLAEGINHSAEHKRAHASVLIPMIQDVLEEANVSIQSLKYLALTVGPGSFTGIRLGLAAAQGFLLAKPLSIFAATTLEVWGYGALNAYPAVERLLVALETKRGDYYTQFFSRSTKTLEQPAILTATEIMEILQQGSLLKILINGDLPMALKEWQDQLLTFPRPLAERVLEYYEECQKVPLHESNHRPLKPFYMGLPYFSKSPVHSCTALTLRAV